MKAYNVTIDYIRAVLIILVILVHIVNFGNLYPDVKYSILAFFMPAFLIITGYLVNIKKSLKDFALYILRILLPYVIMVMGFMVVSLYLPVINFYRQNVFFYLRGKQFRFKIPLPAGIKNNL